MKKSFLNAEQAHKIAEKYPTPFYIYDKRGIVKNIAELKKAFSWNKGFKEFFAVKANPNPFLLKLLLDNGCGLDCSSKAELALAKVMGCKTEDVIFSSNCTPSDEYKNADDIGAIINLDDISDIRHLENAVSHSRGREFPDIICCRYNPGGTFELANGIMDSPRDAKYGMTESQILEAFRILREKGVVRFGIHAFLASNTLGNDYYPKLAKLLFALAVKIKRELDIRVEFVNLSGGIGIPYMPDEAGNDISLIGDEVRKLYNSMLVAEGFDNVKIYTELGRFVLAPYGALITRVIHRKETHKIFIGCDACASNLIRPAMYGAYHHISVMSKNADGVLDRSKIEYEKCDVTGSLCENNDKFAVDRFLPRTEIGDIIYIHDVGAHGHSMGYQYNGRLRCAELLLSEDGEVKLIRRGETLNDYFSTLDFCEYGERNWDEVL